jgi:hypothetical protein
MKRTYKKRTQVNIEMTEDQRNHLKAKASLHGISMTALIKRALDNYNALTAPHSLAEAMTAYCRPCDEEKVSLDGKCTTCGEWTMES